jgi:hypothetical protein
VLRIGSQAPHRHIFEHALPQRADGAFDCVSACNFDPLRRGIGVQN